MSQSDKGSDKGSDNGSENASGNWIDDARVAAAFLTRLPIPLDAAPAPGRLAEASWAFPVVGIGGIMRAEDALEFLIVGAKAVQVGTANFVDPNAMQTILADLEAFCVEQGVADINDLIGTLQL